MSASLEQKLRTLNEAIRSGKGREAQGALQRLGRKELPRRFLASVAELSWRAGLPEIGVRLLHPIVRPAEFIESDATPIEKAEYGVCLVKIGARAFARYAFAA